MGKWDRFCNRGAEKFSVQLGNEMDADRFWTDRFALILIAARPEALPVHRGDHGFGALMPFRFALRQRGEVGDLRRDEQHGRCVLARGHTGAA